MGAPLRIKDSSQVSTGAQSRHRQCQDRGFESLPHLEKSRRIDSLSLISDRRAALMRDVCGTQVDDRVPMLPIHFAGVAAERRIVWSPFYLMAFYLSSTSVPTRNFSR